VAEYVDVHFDKPRRLKFDLEAIERLEGALGGQPLGSIVNNLNQAGVTALKLALWAGLSHEDKSLTPNLIRRMLAQYLESHRNDPVELLEAVNKAIIQCGLFGLNDDGEPVGNSRAEAVTTTKE
jgi:hypothetical protein